MSEDTRGPRERAYDETISPLMTQIIELCKAHQIPMVASFELDLEEDHEPDDPMLCTTVILPPDARSALLRRAANTIKPQQPAFLVFAITTTRPTP